MFPFSLREKGTAGRLRGLFSSVTACPVVCLWFVWMFGKNRIKKKFGAPNSLFTWKKIVLWWQPKSTFPGGNE
ncbi:MAG: hypothetical protein C0622_05350 [Desulfuromonas sp.]|nr:MAG: hypothetical protein C0622_05350 [Desulfuromonas sp.]